MKKRAIIIHSWKAEPTANWFPWAKQQLERLDFEVVVPKMPNPNFPSLKKWLEKMTEAVEVADENTFLIGHSLGSFTILKYLERLEKNAKIGGVILVSGFSDTKFLDDSFNLRLLKLFLKDFSSVVTDYDKIKKICKKIIIFHSDNDKLVPFKQGIKMHAAIGGKFKTVHDGKHLNEGTGNNRFPELIDELLKISK